MGKKQKDVLDKMKSKFVEGCKANGHDPKVCEKIWTDWESLRAMHSINHTLLVMLLSHFRQPI